MSERKTDFSELHTIGIPEKITRIQQNAAVRALGIDPEHVVSITLTPNTVIIEAVLFDPGDGDRPVIVNNQMVMKRHVIIPVAEWRP